MKLLSIGEAISEGEPLEALVAAISVPNPNEPSSSLLDDLLRFFERPMGDLDFPDLEEWDRSNYNSLHDIVTHTRECLV